MAAGVPVVATSVGGPSELIEHEVSGFLAPPRDPEAWLEPVRRLLESVELSQQVAIAARLVITALLRPVDPLDRVSCLYGASRVTGRPLETLAMGELPP